MCRLPTCAGEATLGLRGYAMYRASAQTGARGKSTAKAAGGSCGDALALSMRCCFGGPEYRRRRRRRRPHDRSRNQCAWLAHRIYPSGPMAAIASYVIVTGETGGVAIHPPIHPSIPCPPVLLQLPVIFLSPPVPRVTSPFRNFCPASAQLLNVEYLHT